MNQSQAYLALSIARVWGQLASEHDTEVSGSTLFRTFNDNFVITYTLEIVPIHRRKGFDLEIHSNLRDEHGRTRERMIYDGEMWTEVEL